MFGDANVVDIEGIPCVLDTRLRGLSCCTRL